MVELGTGLIFLAIFVQQHVLGYHHVILFGVPGLILKLFAAAILLATAAIDADTFQIPLILPQIVMAAAVVEGFFGAQPGLPQLNPSGGLGRAALGATIGLIAAFVGLRAGLLPRSFQESQADMPADSAKGPGPPVDQRAPAADLPPPNAAGGRRARIWLAAVAAAVSVAALIFFPLTAATVVVLGAGLLIFLFGVLPQPESSIELSHEVIQETREPAVRREIAKELLFSAIPAAGAVIAFFLPVHAPNWFFMSSLTGIMAGVLAGGGLIWFTRIIGSLILGREAMGLGDVPLMAAIGAVVGAANAVLAFFLAPFAALLWAIILIVRRRPNVLPYGPWLVTAGIIVLLAGHGILNLYLHTFVPVRHHPVRPVFHWPGQR